MARIAFYQNVVYPNLGIMYLSAALKAAGHEVEVFVKTTAGDEDLAAESLKAFNPDIAAFSLITGDHPWALKIAGLLKVQAKKPLLTVFGGPHPTFYPEFIADDAVDVICVGEGEEAFCELAEYIDAGKPIHGIRNLHVKTIAGTVKNEVRPLRQNLDSLSFPDRSLYLSKYPFMRLSHMAVMAGRGCPYTCSYCFNDSLQAMYRGKGPYVRQRSPGNVLAELEELVRDYHPRTIYFQDDVFTLSREFLAAFLPAYRLRIGLPFICLSRAEQLTDETIRLLTDAGCKRLFWGIESGNETLRRNILKRNFTNADIIAKAALLKKYGLKFRTYNILGIPGETIENARETVELNIRIKTDYPWCSVLSPYPKTGIAAEYERLCGTPADIDRIGASFFTTRYPVPREMQNLQKLFYWIVKLPALYPLFRQLVKLPLGRLADYAFLAAYAVSMYTSEMLTVKDIATLARYNVKKMLFSGKKQ